MYEELINSLRICGDWTEQVRRARGGVCDGCKYKKDGVCESFKGNKELLLIEAADAIEDLEFACNRYEKDYKALCEYLPKWIPVTERLPEAEACGCRVLCVLRKKSRGWVWVDDRLFMDGDFWHPKHQKGKVTHWMPLPEPPKEETE